MKSIDLTFVTANIGRAKSITAAARAVRAVAALTRNGIGIYQEIGEGDKYDEKALLVANLPRHRLYEYRNLVIAVPRRFSVIDVDTIHGHGGIPKITPAKGVLGVTLAHRRKPWCRFAVADVHVVAGAWNRKTNEAYEARKMAMWQHYMRVLRRLVGRYRAAGLTTIVAGDLNNVRLKEMVPGDRMLVRFGLDMIVAVEAPGGVTVRELSQQSREMGVEKAHRAHAVKVRITPPAKGAGR